MADFTLVIEITPKGLDTIYDNNLSVTLAQPANAFVSSGQTMAATNSDDRAIAWIAFEPGQQNSVTIALDYFLYATTTTITFPHVIDFNSVTDEPITVGELYVFQNGRFGPAGGESCSCYSVRNSQSTRPGAHLAFGLAQGATVNGTVRPRTALCAASVPYALQASFFLQRRVVVFLSSCSGGTVMPYLPNGLSIPVIENQTVHVGFNDANNTFYLYRQIPSGGG